jgi:Ala-tRNA(Pro) deacylase
MLAIADVINYLSSNAVTFRVLTHPPAYSAIELARVHHVPSRNVVRTELYKADHRLAMAVFPSDRKVDLPALVDTLHAREIARVDAWEQERLFNGCDIGTAPPLGNLFGVLVVADAAFEGGGPVVFRLCSHSTSLLMDWHDYKHLVSPLVAQISHPAVQLIAEPE